MFIKIITVASVLTVCKGMAPLHPNREELKSNQAVSSQSFTREDVPLAYKFQAVHTYTTGKTNPEAPLNNAYSHQRAANSYESAHQTRQPKPQNAQYLRPTHQQSLHRPQNFEKFPVKSLQYAPVPHTVQNDATHEAPYFKPTREEMQKVIVPFRVIFVKPTTPDLDNMPLLDSTLNRAPQGHSLHLNTYQKNPYQSQNTNNVGMQKIMYPQLLRMFQEHRTSTSINQHTQLPHTSQKYAGNGETAAVAQDSRQAGEYAQFQPQLPLPYSTPQKPQFQTEAPKAYQFVPIKTGNHQHHPDKPYLDEAVQYPSHTQALFRTNTGQLEAETSENVKITYLYPVTIPRTPVAHR